MSGIVLVQPGGAGVINAGGASSVATGQILPGVRCYLSFVGATSSWTWGFSAPGGSVSTLRYPTTKTPDFAPDLDGVTGYTVTFTDSLSNVYTLTLSCSKQHAAGGTYGRVEYVDTFATLRTRLPAGANEVISIGSIATVGDGGAGDFYWDPTSVVADDGGATAAVAGTPVGRWRRFGQAGVAVLEQFGGKGDADGAGGGTDNIPAFNAAMTALGANGGVIEVGYGRFRIASTLTISNRVTIRGRGNTNTVGTFGATEIIKASTMTGDAITMTGRCAVLERFVLRGEAGNAGNGITLSGTTGSQVLDRVSVFSMGNDGIRVGQDVGGNSDSWKMIDIVSCSNGRDGLHLSSNIASVPDCNAGKCDGPMLRQNGRYGLYLGNAWFNTFTALLSEANTDYGVYVDDGAAWCNFTGGDVETNGGAGTFPDFFVHPNARVIKWGIAFLEEFLAISTATPSVGCHQSFTCNYAGPTTITDFLDASKDHEITIRLGPNATIKHDITKISLLGSADLAPQDNSSFIHFKRFGTVWLEQWRRANVFNYFPGLQSDVIAEHTTDAGVTVDGVLLLDGYVQIPAAAISVNTAGFGMGGRTATTGAGGGGSAQDFSFAYDPSAVYLAISRGTDRSDRTKNGLLVKLFTENASGTFVAIDVVTPVLNTIAGSSIVLTRSGNLINMNTAYTGGIGTDLVDVHLNLIRLT